MISPIGEAGSPTRKHMDMVFNSIIIPAFEDLDFEKPYRSDHDDDPGLITDKMIESIATDKLVIAVLTDLNPNVFYELGIRHSMQRPTIHLCANGTRLPFDNNDQRTIFYDIEDYYNHREASKKINSYVKNILKDDFIVSNPVTRYKDNLKLRESADPSDRKILDLQSEVSHLKMALHSLERDVLRRPSNRRTPAPPDQNEFETMDDLLQRAKKQLEDSQKYPLLKGQNKSSKASIKYLKKDED